jgi:hypothetical protein
MNFDTAKVIFDRGSFDEWCVFIDDGHRRFAPTDSWYFSILLEFTQDRDAETIYRDFVRIYDQTTEAVAEETLLLIHEMSTQYADPAKARIIFTVLYYGMIAEENKKNDKGEKLPLRRRIKRLGVYMVLMEGVQPQVAANYSRGLGADYLDKVCFYRGF